MVMAAPISASASLCSSSAGSKSSLCTLSSSVPYQKTSKSQLSPWFFQVGASLFSSYSGLKHLGLSISSKSLKLERKRRCRGKVIHASLFGVGAPEALVIGVVALLVFGPKGLAEVARNLGKTLRTFQPTIRELQEVSREFKSTLEREIGLDDIATQNTNSPSRTNLTSAPPSAATTPDPSSVTEPNGAPSPSRAYTSEEYLKVTEEQLKATAVQQTEQTAPEEESQIEHETQSQG